MPRRNGQPVSLRAPGAVIRELSAGETRLAHLALRGLRLEYQSQEGFVSYVDEVLRPEGYRLLGSFLPEHEDAVAVAGFRLGSSLAWRHYIYVDDLVTVPQARRQGHARALLDWLVQEGQRLGCAGLHLDSATGAERFDAHRLYHKLGLTIDAHHFARWL